MPSHKIFFTGKNQVELRPEPLDAPAPDQIQVRTRKTLISTGTECIVLSRNYAPGTHWDRWISSRGGAFAPGYLNAGEVVALGAQVKDFQIGNRVACRAAHCQAFNIAAERALPIPAGVSDEEAAWFGLAKITQVGAESAREAVMQHTDGRGADVVYDITGHPAVFAPALGLARNFGTLLLLGDAGAPAQQQLTSDVITRGVTIVGAHDGMSAPQVSATDFWTEHNYGAAIFSLHRARPNERRRPHHQPLLAARYRPSLRAFADRPRQRHGRDFRLDAALENRRPIENAVLPPR